MLLNNTCIFIYACIFANSFWKEVRNSRKGGVPVHDADIKGSEFNSSHKHTRSQIYTEHGPVGRGGTWKLAEQLQVRPLRESPHEEGRSG